MVVLRDALALRRPRIVIGTPQSCAKDKIVPLFNRAIRHRYPTFLLPVLLLLGGCTLRLVSPYDAVIDDGLRDYRQSLNVFLKNMGDVAGKSAGTYEANRDTYNKLDTQISILVDRAKYSGSPACSLTQQVTDRIVAAMGSSIPAELKAAPQTSGGDALGCMHRLLVLVQDQLGIIQQIHSTTDKCHNLEASNPSELSCIRPATAKTALDITNQSINAAAVVEMALKQNTEVK